MNVRKDIQRGLTGRQIIDWCVQKTQQEQGFFYQNSFASGYGLIRFSTLALESIFPPSRGRTGYWKNGRHAFYEIHHQEGVFRFLCLVSSEGLGTRKQKVYRQLLKAAKAEETDAGVAVLKTWDLKHLLNAAFHETDALDNFYDCEFKYFERELELWRKDPSHLLRDFPDPEQSLVRNAELPETLYMEGALKTILTDSFERNLQARRRCIAIHGTACTVCGFDFGLVYGEAFAGKIEVHHRKPLSEIRENYLVDPVNDLIPVCPNCHLILHSKAEGVFTVEDLKSFQQRKLITKEAFSDVGQP